MTELRMKVLMQVLCAAHLTYKVESPYSRRGGILVVSPSGHGKSTLISKLSDMEKVLLISDLTTRQLVDLKSDITEGKYHTLIIDEMQKLYQRREDTASNLEGHICALVEQGFSDLPGSKPSARGLPAQALVLGLCTDEFFSKKEREWNNSFLRRFLVVMFRLKDPDVFGNAIEKWDLVRISQGMFLNVSPEPIPYSLKPGEAVQIRRWILKGGQDDKTPFQLMQKIACVLRWRFRLMKHKDETMDIMQEFSLSLGKKGCFLTFDGREN